MSKTSIENINNEPLYLFHQGTNYNSYDYLGAHFTKIRGKNAVVFRTWAPNATSVSVVGDFNSWDKNKNVMNNKKKIILNIPAPLESPKIILTILYESKLLTPA